MTTNELKAMIENLENVEQFMEDLRSAVEDEEVKAVLKNYGLEIEVEDLAKLDLGEDELDVDSLDMVSGGCKCKGILKRVVAKVLGWAYKAATGKKLKCPDCGD